ncbi:hypothetical protein A2331_04810 [Candidatus Falkowbacteria bacterium RIFOXYB2_FULL_34_18]|uniref:Helicase ATP-binding domain-containing protein n=1 Tax=Candidatus Falkowbacteria bacterium RIFOXYD2_FULL_34_120 TaxID=1798007 RepID=A0A1F5TNQ6_9BACT|nr:MAG: hypothetical protein A2331_04810 [Candidatus Falkowbacteria bacterium RIFOXYB2_FULL_34_18]OGF28859.1 MAG: hypothetical protein A2500_00565 [Candidatus Falkowbacteria bacterium RIFOXYC12_FULL_34_55]OGF35768.1 MAG: hypothetical protein A2466_04505 [Candidatus Falkowbacteria bacterium RIFOXYC2_FULL_34_220]OGF38434.1 MAG: hypothetical protein A2515_01945 [Candidatus Falkowbacteria bacterium RIFOXYD12_FULL_34_57]OGF40510.1 MAG: hypothetical protein A2531_02980 [Candidatus Falkowbacteria bact
MSENNRVIVIAPTRATCVNILIALKNENLPETLLMQLKKEEILAAIEEGSFFIVSGTGTGKTLAIQKMAQRILGEDLKIDIVTREHEATEKTFDSNVLVITPGVALNWIMAGIITNDDRIVVDEIHQTSVHLELSLAFLRMLGCNIIGLSATIDPKVYADYLNVNTVISCSAFDPSKKARVEIIKREYGTKQEPAPLQPETFLKNKIFDFAREGRGVAVFVPTKAMTENLVKEFDGVCGVHCDFYHGGENAQKLEQFLRGEVKKPFMVFMTPAGASSLNILGLDTVVILDEMLDEQEHSGVQTLERAKLGNNELLQMGGRVNGRANNAHIYIISYRNIDFHNLQPTVPKFKLGGDIPRLALICAKLNADVSQIELIQPINRALYKKEVEYFRGRGIIEKNGNGLTVYGKRVEPLPVEPMWAEMIVHAQDKGDEELLRLVVVCSCVSSLYSLLRNGSNSYSDMILYDSDHATSYNIIAEAMSKFGYIRYSQDGGEYGFRGNWINYDGDETEKGEFAEWCDKHNLNSKAIREVTLALRSVCWYLGMDLPNPEIMKKISRDDDVYRRFVDFLVSVQSLDFVFNERSLRAMSEYCMVWSANCSSASGFIFGKIRHWTDKKGIIRATVEGTSIPKYMIEQFSVKIPCRLESVSEKGVKMMMKQIFAGEAIDLVSDFIADADVPEEFVEEAQKKFIDQIMELSACGKFWNIKNQNSHVRQISLEMERRFYGEIRALTEEDEINLYRWAFTGKRIISPISLRDALESGELREEDLLLKLEDHISPEELARVEAEFPLTVTVDGESFMVNYGLSFPTIEVSEEFARSTRVVDVGLPNGKEIKLVCGCILAENFAQLLEKIDGEKLNQAWSEARRKYEVRITDENLHMLADIGKSIEIAPGVTAYLTVLKTSTDYGKFQLAKTLEIAKNCSDEYLGRIIESKIGMNMQIPEGKSYYQEVGPTWNPKRELTNIGKDLQARLQTMLNSHLESIKSGDLDDLPAMIESIRKEAREIKDSFIDIEYQFEGLMRGKRVEELTYILNTVQEILAYKEKDLGRIVSDMTQINGVRKTGNKLYLGLKELFPETARKPDEYGVDTLKMAASILKGDAGSDLDGLLAEIMEITNYTPKQVLKGVSIATGFKRGKRLLAELQKQEIDDLSITVMEAVEG